VVERTQEILMQKEEILVQSEHLKEANEWIKAKNIELESQKNEIEIKKNQLEVSNATKNKFFRIIAHDLRNPISTLVNTTGYILTDIDSIDRKTTKQFIENLNSLSLKTYNLLENLLDWSSAQMGGFEYKPKSLVLKSLVMQNVELISGDLDQKNINVSIDIPDDLKVRADENMLLTIIRNLLSNAVKFTFDNGTIKIYTQISEGVCKLSISDNGVGISEENLEKLFKVDKDVRTYGTRNEKGSGIGLLLCKEFAELNGGTIVVESKPNEGSTFAITLMLA
ncbi:MAG: HAMP domain-containing sensor histidine kinase, partial [Perlabentimonas sp.]